MSTDLKPTTLTLQIDAGEDVNEEVLDRLTRQLLLELRDLDVDSVELIQGEQLPPGAKATELTMLGQITVALAPAVFTKFTDYLRGWVQRGEQRVVVEVRDGDQSRKVEFTSSTQPSSQDLESLIKMLKGTLNQEG